MKYKICGIYINVTKCDVTFALNEGSNSVAMPLFEIICLLILNIT